MKALLLVVMICALFLSVGVAAAQDGDPCFFQREGHTIGNKCVTSGETRVSVEYPIDLAQNLLIADTIDSFIQREKMSFLQSVEKGFNPQADLSITYQEIHHSNSVVSLVFRVFEEHWIEVHGIVTFQTFTFDLKANRLLTLDDLFLPNSNFLARLAPLVNAGLTLRLGEAYTFPVASNPSDLQAFALDQTTLTFYFADYQLGSYALGQQQISVPLSLLTSVLKPEFAP